MKKKIAWILILCMLFALSACGGESAGETQGEGTTAAVSGTAGEASENVGSEETTEPAAEDGFVFTYQGVEIRLNADMAPILEQLGEPISYTETTSCAFDGLDKTYYYGSFYIDTYPDGDEDYVYSFWFCDDGVATTEGIYIGAGESQVVSAYPDAVYNGANAYTVTSGGETLLILLTDGLVSSIQYSISVGS